LHPLLLFHQTKTISDAVLETKVLRHLENKKSLGPGLGKSRFHH